jgi:kumamolisin
MPGKSMMKVLAENHGGRATAWAVALALAVTGLLVLAICAWSDSAAPDYRTIRGPYAKLLAASSDLGPSHAGDAQITATLPGPARPTALMEWATSNQLQVRWRPGDDWAIIDGPAQQVAKAFDVSVRDYRGRQGRVFYASPQQPETPEPLRDAVTGVGRILGYLPHHSASPGFLPLDVPEKGLRPHQLLTAYNADPLAAAGFTGKGATIVFFEFDGYDQQDLDDYAATSGLPQFTPVLIGGQPGPPNGEAVMDLEVAHAIAPDAQKVVVNARPTVEGSGGHEKIAQMFESVDRQFPGAIWSLSIGWGCDSLVKEPDLAPVQAALDAAQQHGTSAFDASGDNAGRECRGGEDWSTPPGPDDIGLDSVASLPSMTSVGGTTLSTDDQGGWITEHAWFDSPLSQGSSGGVSALYGRPAWQRRLSAQRDVKQRRLSPDVAAVADPSTGVRIIFDQQELTGAGTSQSAPIWAALAVLMNQYLAANGGHALGNLNPLLYRVASGANLPGFRSVPLGGNAVDLAVPGYDLVTGLGSPNVDNLARDLLDIQLGRAPR